MSAIYRLKSFVHLLRRFAKAQTREAFGRVSLAGSEWDATPWVIPLHEAVVPSLLHAFRQGALSWEQGEQRARGIVVPTGAVVRRGILRRGDVGHARMNHLGRYNPIVKGARSQPSPRELDAVNELALRFSRDTNRKLTANVREAREAIRHILATGIARDQADALLARRLRRIIDDPNKALEIAITESTRARNAGRHLAARDAGKKTKTWHAHAGSCVRCQELDGVEVDLDEPFTIDGTGPYAQVMYPPLHSYCYCDWSTNDG